MMKGIHRMTDRIPSAPPLAAAAGPAERTKLFSKSGGRGHERPNSQEKEQRALHPSRQAHTERLEQLDRVTLIQDRPGHYVGTVSHKNIAKSDEKP